MQAIMQPTPDIAATISRKLGDLMGRSEPLSQRALAAEIGIPTMVLNRAINGTGTPTAEAIIKIARYYGISTDELLGVPPNRSVRRQSKRRAGKATS